MANTQGLTGWWAAFEGVNFAAGDLPALFFETLIRGLDLRAVRSNPRASTSVATWHVHFDGVRVLAVDVYQDSLKCRFLKLPYATQALRDCRWVMFENWNHDRTAYISIDSVELATSVQKLLSGHLQRIRSALEGREPGLRKPSRDKDRLREHYFETTVANEIHKIEVGLRLVRRQLVTATGRIDLLCRDATDQPVILELKVGDGDSGAIGQLRRYMGFIEKATTRPARGTLVFQSENPQVRAEAAKLGLEFHVWPFPE